MCRRQLHRVCNDLHVQPQQHTSVERKSGGEPISQGGTLGATGYTFGANQGLTLPFASPVYSIDISFSFDTTSGFRKILDFKGLTSDEGLYNLNGTLDYFNFAGGPTVQIPAGTIVDARLTRDATGLVTGYVNGVSQFSFIDSTNSAGALSSLAFFMDDFHTGLREASSGFARGRGRKR